MSCDLRFLFDCLPVFHLYLIICPTLMCQIISYVRLWHVSGAYISLHSVLFLTFIPSVYLVSFLFFGLWTLLDFLPVLFLELLYWFLGFELYYSVVVVSTGSGSLAQNLAPVSSHCDEDMWIQRHGHSQAEESATRQKHLKQYDKVARRMNKKLKE